MVKPKTKATWTVAGILSMIYLLGIAAGIFATLAYMGFNVEPAPYCPTEDSCTVDYHDGKWHVKRETP